MRKIVFTNGCFDILHRGHIELLRYCAQLGDKVIVGLNSDASVNRLKGSSRPVNSDIDRRHVLEAIEYVDEVVIFEEDTPLNLIKLVRPDIIVKGSDYREEDVIGAGYAQIVLFDYINGYSTTKTIQDLTSR